MMFTRCRFYRTMPSSLSTSCCCYTIVFTFTYVSRWRMQCATHLVRIHEQMHTHTLSMSTRKTKYKTQSVTLSWLEYVLLLLLLGLGAALVYSLLIDSTFSTFRVFLLLFFYTRQRLNFSHCVHDLSLSSSVRVESSTLRFRCAPDYVCYSPIAETSILFFMPSVVCYFTAVVKSRNATKCVGDDWSGWRAKNTEMYVFENF